MLVLGKLDEAGQALDELEARSGVPQPLRNWITLHRGLVLLLVGKEPEARETFAEIEKRGRYSQDPGEDNISDFFLDTARLLAGAFSVQASEVREKYAKPNYEAIALLLFGLKDWQMGKFEEAGPLLTQFEHSTPQAPHQWIANYKDFASRYTDAYKEYQEVSKMLRTANSIEERKTAVATAKEARDKIAVKGRLATILDETIKTIEESITRQETEDNKKMADAEAADAKALEEMRAQTGPLLAQLKFNDARAIASATLVKGEKAKIEQQNVLKSTEALTKFKARLIADINATPYTQPIRRKTGAVIPGVAVWPTKWVWRFARRTAAHRCFGPTVRWTRCGTWGAFSCSLSRHPPKSRTGNGGRGFSGFLPGKKPKHLRFSPQPQRQSRSTRTICRVSRERQTLPNRKYVQVQRGIFSRALDASTFSSGRRNPFSATSR